VFIVINVDAGLRFFSLCVYLTYMDLELELKGGLKRY